MHQMAAATTTTTTIFQACKKRERKPKTHGFQSFASPGSLNIHLSASFRENIRLFLYEYGELEDFTVGDNPIWCTLLVSEINGVVFPFYTIEETVKCSSYSFCNHCRHVGWSHHFVSKRRYHLVIPMHDEWNKPLKENTMDLDTHLLHAVIHCNGYGHLLCIDGTEESSNYLSACDIMGLFDRVCTSLRTRKITVRDVMKKRSMDLRLLYSVAYGYPWFGKWGYKFYHGTYGVTEQNYNRAIEILSSLDLNKINNDSLNTNEGKTINEIICRYRDASETQLVTVGELLEFMLAFESKVPVQRKRIMALSSCSSKSSKRTSCQRKLPVQGSPMKLKTFAQSIEKLDFRWPKSRLEYAAEVIFTILQENKASNRSSMSRKELHDAAHQHIRDKAVIDFVLKCIDNTIMGNQIIHRSKNPGSRLLAFTLQDIANGDANGGAFEKQKAKSGPMILKPGVDVYEDIFYLYKHVLLGYPEPDLAGFATRVVLDSKYFVKEWTFSDEREDSSIRLMCQVLPTNDELETKLTRPLPPGEVMVVPLHMKVSKLKLVAQRALRDTYCIMDKFVVKKITAVMREEEGLLSCTGEWGIQVWVRGCGLDLDTELMYEGGPQNWTVDCGCGTKDDDGERMVACDVCHVWQHTRCSGISDDEAAPPVFYCARCRLCCARLKA